MFLYNLAKGRNQRLSQPEAENELRSGHQKLGRQTLEEAAGALVLHHVRQDAESRFGVLKVAVLDTGLDHIQRSGNDQGGAGTAHRGDEVLGPAGGVVVLQGVDVFLGEGGATEELYISVSIKMHYMDWEFSAYREGPGGVTGSSPASSPVETEALIRNDLEQTTAAEGLRVSLTLDLQDIQRQEDDLSDTDQTRFYCQYMRGSMFCPRGEQTCQRWRA